MVVARRAEPSEERRAALRKHDWILSVPDRRLLSSNQLAFSKAGVVT